MTIGYNDAADLAMEMGYKGFSKLQEKAFRNQYVYDENSWLFIIGSTSSGKTLIPQILFFLGYRKKDNTSGGKMLYVVPYRALANQKMEEFESISQVLNMDLKVVQSTGEYRKYDHDIINGKIDVAVIIYEKLYMFMGIDNEFLKHYDMIVMDEIGLTQDLERGIRIDFALHEIKSKYKKRVIALGTPFYDWNNYVETYGFISVHEDQRPIELKNIPIYFTQERVNYVPEECSYIPLRIFNSLHNNPNDQNPRRRTDYIIEDICRFHLSSNQQILIFINNRNEVKLLSRRLSKSLLDEGIVHSACTIEECRSFIRQSTGLTDDWLYGILEDEDYFSFSCGISFHNSALPAQLRQLIEKEILTNEGRLKIVCCTETLAYGINSNVDVIIIPSLYKQQTKYRKSGSLTSNEFMNYTGRAGRLRKDIPINEQNNIVGYAYTFIKSNYNLADDLRRENDQKFAWKKLQDDINKPVKTASKYFEITGDDRAFYILSIIKSNSQSSGIKKKQIESIINSLPCEEGYIKEASEIVDYPLEKLIERGLVYIVNEDEDVLDIDEEIYKLTTVGNDLAGFIISLADFDSVLAATGKSISNISFKIADLLLSIVNGKEIQKDVGESIGIVATNDPDILSDMINSIKAIRNEFKAEYSEELSDSIDTTINNVNRRIEGIKNYIKHNKRVLYTSNLQEINDYQHELNKRIRSVVRDRKFQSYRLLSAMMMWKSEKHSIKQIYQSFLITYEQIKGLAQQVSYRLDLISNALPLARNETGVLLYGLFGRELLSQKQLEIKELSDAIYFRIPTRICRVLGIQCEDSEMAQNINRFARTYDYLSELKLSNTKNFNAKQRKRLSRIKDNLRKWPSSWGDRLVNEFGEVLQL